MSAPNVAYMWEDLPEYRCTQQLGRCIGRILVTLPPPFGARLGRTLIRTSVLIAQGIAGAHAEMPPGDDLSREERERFRSGCLASIGICRDVLRLLKAQRLGSVPDRLVALELLDRIESSVRARPLPGHPIA